MTAAGAKAELILPYERFLDRPEIYLAVSRARTQTSSHVLVLAVGVLRNPSAGWHSRGPRSQASSPAASAASANEITYLFFGSSQPSTHRNLLQLTGFNLQ